MIGPPPSRPMVDNLGIGVILVPAGAEYRAVQRAMDKVQDGPRVMAIPAGPQGLRRFLQTWEDRHLLESDGVLLMGLGGSLSSELEVGDSRVVEQVFEAGSAQVYGCDRNLTAQLSERLGVATGVGVSCDRVITTAVEKRQLCEHYGAHIVDMESATLLKELPHSKIVIVRVISDSSHHDLPDISDAIKPDGSIKLFAMALSFFSHPVAALRLIRGALTGLQCVETTILTFFK